MTAPDNAAGPDGRLKTRRSLLWSGGAYGATALINFGVLYVLTRCLGPSEMALVFISIIFQDLALLFVENGMGSYVVQANNLTTRDHASLFWQGLAFGGLLALGLFFLAAPLAGFFHSPLLVDALKFTAFSFLAIAAAFPQRALLQKKMHFRRIAVAEFTGMLLAAMITLLMAVRGYGVISYMAGFLVRKTTEAILLWMKDPWWPTPAMSSEQATKLFSYSVFASNALVLSYSVRLIDTFFVGRLLGVQTLGLYSLASNMIFFPVSKCVATFNRVFIATFSQVRQDPERLRDAYVGAFARLCWLLLPTLVLLGLLAPELMQAFFQPAWSPVAPLVRIMILNGLLIAFLRLGEPLLLSLGQVRAVFVVYLIGLLLTTGLLALLTSMGAEGAAWAVSLGMLPSALLMTFALRKAIGFSWPGALRHSRAVLWATCIAATVTGLFKVLSPGMISVLLPSEMNAPMIKPAITLGIAGIIFSGIYLGLWKYLRARTK